MAAIMVRERKQDFGLFTAVRDTHTAGELEHCAFAPREQTEIASPGLPVTEQYNYSAHRRWARTDVGSTWPAMIERASHECYLGGPYRCT